MASFLIDMTERDLKVYHWFQDTSLALQALAKYSELTTDVKIDLKIVIKPSYVPNGFPDSMSININKANAFLQQSFDVSNAYLVVLALYLFILLFLHIPIYFDQISS